MMTIRTATVTDLPEMLEIYNDIILHTTAVYHYAPHTMEMRRDWFETKKAEGHPVFVAESEGRVVGFSSLGPFRAWPAYKYTVENSIYVSADQRGKGLGKLLLAPLIPAARERQMHAIIAAIDASNAVSLQMHRSFGFEEVAHLRQVGYKFGKWLDLKFMEFLLDTPEHPKED